MPYGFARLFKPQLTSRLELTPWSISHEQVFGGKEDNENVAKNSNDHVSLNDLPVDSDPFGLDLLINKKSVKASHLVNSVTPPFPPSFTPATT
ncbi:hypothetical protein Tco_1552838, partial [Tanacetum coccineum]